MTADAQPAPFVVGAGRSGTTLLRMMLDSHSELAIPPETRFIPRVIRECRADGAGAASVAGVLAAERNWADFGISEADYRAELESRGSLEPADAVRAFYELYAARHGKSRWGDKTPSYGRRLQMLGRWIPEAHFVHLIRDGRDVALSWMRFRSLRGDDPRTVTHWAEVWRDTVEEIRGKSATVSHYLEVRFEDLIERPAEALERICEFVELPFDAAMLDYHERAEDRLGELAGGLPPSEKQPARTAADRIEPHRLVTEPPQADRAGAWRSEMTYEQKVEFDRIAGELQRSLDEA